MILLHWAIARSIDWREREREREREKERGRREREKGEGERVGGGRERGYVGSKTAVIWGTHSMASA